MDSIRLLKGYASKLEASQKALSALERRCKALADKQAGWRRRGRIWCLR